MRFVTSGKRKRAIARAIITDGKGIITIPFSSDNELEKIAAHIS